MNQAGKWVVASLAAAADSYAPRMDPERRTARIALVLSIVALVLGPGAGFVAGHAFAQDGPQGTRGPQGIQGAPGQSGPQGPASQISGALVLGEHGDCPAGTSYETGRIPSVDWFDEWVEDGEPYSFDEYQLCRVG